jgi:hypothetical protein
LPRRRRQWQSLRIRLKKQPKSPRSTAESANCAALLTDRPMAEGTNREPLRTDL